MWLLLRVWHVEVLASVASVPGANLFARTSYCVAPPSWRELPAEDLGRRVGVLLHAAYAKRNHLSAQNDDPTPMWLIAYDHEWVANAEMPPLSPGKDGMVVHNAEISSINVDSAIDELDKLRTQPRPGLTTRPWQDAFSAWRIEANGETWHLLRHDERETVFSECLG
jgi:hypothetical protein